MKRSTILAAVGAITVFVVLGVAITQARKAYAKRAPKIKFECVQYQSIPYRGVIGYYKVGNVSVPIMGTLHRNVCVASQPRCIEGGDNYEGPKTCSKLMENALLPNRKKYEDG